MTLVEGILVWWKKMHEESIKKQIVQILRYLYKRNLISALGGNISARREGESTFWITPSGTFKPEVQPQHLIKCNVQGERLKGTDEPSRETPMHTAIYTTRPSMQAVVHAHTPLTIGLTLGDIPVKPITPEAALLLGEVPVVPLAMSGTPLANQVTQYVRDHEVLILQNHGAVAMGQDLETAYARIDALEETAKMVMVAKLCGNQEVSIPDKIKHNLLD